MMMRMVRTKTWRTEVFGRAREGVGLPDFLSLYLAPDFCFSKYFPNMMPDFLHKTSFVYLAGKYFPNQIMMTPVGGFVDAYADEKGSAGSDRITPSQLPRPTCQSCNLT